MTGSTNNQAAWPPPVVAWLVSDDRVIASLIVADSVSTRTRGLLGRSGIEGAIYLERTRWVHTLGMRFPIDVAYLDRDGVVLRVERLARHRVGRPVPGARSVVEAEAGAFERWGVNVGQKLEVRR
jgi:uncharacterized protein